MKPKATIVIEMATGPDGQEGIAVDITCKPELAANEEPTIVHDVVHAIVEMILGASEEAVIVDDDKREVIKGEDDGEGTGQLH